MRRLCHADLSAAARVLAMLSAAARPGAMARLIDEAEAADRYARRFGRAHPRWGNGTLEGAARGHPLAAPAPLSDIAYLDCLALVLGALAGHRRRFHRKT